MSTIEPDIARLAAQVRQSWLQQGLSVSKPDLTLLDTSVRDRLAPDFVTFLDVAGLPDEPDALLIEWWRPSQWKVVNDSLLAFADYLIHSHVYALWLAGTAADGTIAVLANDDPQPPIGTTVEFLTAYLADDHVLYG